MSWREGSAGRTRVRPSSVVGLASISQVPALYGVGSPARAPLRLLARGEGLPGDVAALEPEHVARFLASGETLRRPNGKAKRTGSLNALRSSLRGFFEYLERAGLVDRSPARVLRMARVGATPPRGMRPEEVAALLGVLAADTTGAGRRGGPALAPLLTSSVSMGSPRSAGTASRS
jgi:hypothetical protein